MLGKSTGISTMPDIELMQVHVDTLFCLDSARQMRSVNEIGDPPAPLFYMGRTRSGNVWHFRHDLPTRLMEELDQLCRAEPVALDFHRPPQQDAAIRAAIHRHLPEQPLEEYRGPAYRIPRLENRQAQQVVLVTAANGALLHSTFPWMIPWLDHPDIGPVAAAVEQDKAVSLCFCARRPAEATEAGVETLPGFRGKGYATAAVAAWAAEVTHRGCMPLYSTSWDNVASQAVARHLDMIVYGEDWSL